MRYEPVFYPDYFELAVVLGLLMVSAVLFVVLYKFITITNEYNHLRTLSVFDLYIEMTRCFSAITVCASKGDSNGAHHASRKVWLISMVLQRDEYNQMEKALAESYFENYLALFRQMDRGGDVVAYEKGWHDRWSRKAIEDCRASAGRRHKAAFDN